MTSIATLTIQGVVKTICYLTISTTSPTEYNVTEVCNNPNGYTVTINTDSNRALYDGKIVSNGILSHYNALSTSNNVTKKLSLTYPFSYVTVTIQGD